MDLNIGEVILAKRKEKRWTQEQLANAVGVSTPAVSKWETGATYPDITLLSPIARALNTTVDELLSYQNELSQTDVTELAKQAGSIYESKGFDAGWAFCQQKLKEYPNSIPLKFHLGSLFQSFLLLKGGIGKEEIQTYYRSATDTYEEVLTSGHPKYAFSTTVILIGYYVMLNDLDRAEDLFEDLPKQQIDPNFLYPSICALRERHDEAIKATQENIFRYIPKISQALSLLCSYAQEHKDMERAMSLANINLQMTELFGMKDGLAYPNIIKLLAIQGEKKSALDYFERYAQSILDLSYDYTNNPCFDTLTEQLGDASYIKKILAQSIIIDKGYASLENEPRYKQVIGKLQELANAQTHTFN